MMLAKLMEGRGEATQLSDGEAYAFLVNEKHTVHLRSFNESPRFYIYAKVKQLSKEQASEELLGSLLESNLFSKVGSKTYFAWHKESASLLLMSSFDAGSTTTLELDKGIEDLISALEHWQKKFSLATTFPGHEGEDLLDLLSQKKQVFFI